MYIFQITILSQIYTPYGNNFFLEEKYFPSEQLILGGWK